MLAQGDIKGCRDCYETAIQVSVADEDVREIVQEKWALGEEIKLLDRLDRVRNSAPSHTEVFSHNILVVVLRHLDLEVHCLWCLFWFWKGAASVMFVHEASSTQCVPLGPCSDGVCMLRVCDFSNRCPAKDPFVLQKMS